jgi:hypothetical protein
VDDEVRLGRLTVSMEVTAGSWALERMGEWCTVASIVPDRFPAYARVFHPAYRFAANPADGDRTAGRHQMAEGDTLWRREVRWAEVAAANGRVAHPAMEWASITGAFRYLDRDSQPGIWDEAPATATLPSHTVIELIDTLGRYTRTAERCWFAIWEGYGDLPYLGSLRPPRLKIPNRDMILLSGPLSAMPEESFSESWYRTIPDFRHSHYRSPSLWWPDDHAWCVGTDVDLNSTYIGASAECVQALLADDRLEIMPVSSSQTTTFDTDTINPEPAGSPYS